MYMRLCQMTRFLMALSSLYLKMLYDTRLSRCLSFRCPVESSTPRLLYTLTTLSLSFVSMALRMLRMLTMDRSFSNKSSDSTAFLPPPRPWLLPSAVTAPIRTAAMLSDGA